MSSDQNKECNQDIEFAIRLSLHEQGITNESFICRYIDKIRENDYNVDVLPDINTLYGNLNITDEIYDNSFKILKSYRDGDVYNLINNTDYRIYTTRNLNSNQLPNTLNSYLPQQFLSSFEFSSNSNLNSNIFNSNFVNNIMNSLMTNNLNIGEDVQLPLSSKSLEELSKNKYDLDSFKDKLNNEGKTIDPKCSICQCSFDKSDSDSDSDTDEEIDEDEYKILQLDCGHYFHCNCIKMWLKDYNHTCPICNKECGEHEPRL